MLKLDSVQVSYGAIQALRGVSLRVPSGEVVAIIGANGAGKSTLLKASSGSSPWGPAGWFWREGHHVGPVLQENRAWGRAFAGGTWRVSDQSVRDNLLLGAYAKKDDRQASRRRSSAPMSCSRAFGSPGADGRDLSGASNRCSPSREALMSEPKLLLLDEPSLGLAPLIIQDIFRTIRSLREMGLTILLVEQMANQALAVADRAYVLETGRITHQGKGSELLNDPRVRAAYLGVH